MRRSWWEQGTLQLLAQYRTLGTPAVWYSPSGLQLDPKFGTPGPHSNRWGSSGHKAKPGIEFSSPGWVAGPHNFQDKL